MKDKQEIQQLIDRNKFKEALLIVERLEKQENGSLENRLIQQLFKSQIFSKMGETKKGVELADEILTVVQDQVPRKPLLLVDAIITKSEALRFDGQISSIFSREKIHEHLQLLEKGEQILNNIMHLEPESQEIVNREAVLQRNKGMIFRELKEFDGAEECFQKSVALYDKAGNKKEKIGALLSLAFTFGAKNELDHQLETLQDCLKLQEEIEDREGIAGTLGSIAYAYQTKGKLDTALEYLQRSQQLAEELPRIVGAAQLLFGIGIFYLLSRAEGLKALDAFQKSLVIYEELENKQGMAWCLHRIGNISHFHTGDLLEALEYYEKSSALFKEVNDKLGLGFPLGMTGYIHRQRGDPDLALTYFHEALALFEEAGQELVYCEALLWIGQAYQSKGDVTAATDHYERSLQLLEERKWDHPYIEAQAYLSLIELMLENNENSKAGEYFKRFTEYYESRKLPSPFIGPFYKISEALVLKASPRIKDKARAQSLLQEVIDEDLGIEKYDINSSASLHLCELLLFELKASPDEITEESEVFQEVKLLIDNLSSLAKQKYSFPLLINTLMLQAKFALIEGNITAAMQFLNQAKAIAEEKGLAKLVEKVLEEENQLSKQLDTWKNLVQENAPLQERLEHARLEKYISRALKTVIVGQKH